MKNDFVILVGSYDGYADLWNPFFNLINKMWADNNRKIYLVNNYLRPTYKDTEVINTGKEISWSKKMLYALKRIKEDNLLFMLEDYYLGEKVNEEVVNSYFLRFKEEDMCYLKLVAIPVVRSKKDIIKVLDKDRYGVNLQAAFWKKETLINILETGDFSAWEFESKFNNNLFNVNNANYYRVTHDILKIKNAVIKGKWYPKTIDYFNEIGIDLVGNSKRSVMTKSELRRYDLKTYLSSIIPDFIIRILKPLLKKIGLKFVT